MAKAFFRKKIYSARTLGEKLRTFRKKKRLTLSDAEEATKVRLKYLDALEKGNYSELPADVYVLGFLTKYADFLGAPKDELILDFHRERRLAVQGSFKSHEVRAPGFKKEKIFITPRVLVIFSLIILGLAFSVYIFYSIKNFTEPPNLEISAPSTETVIRQNEVQVIGKTDPGASLSINDQVVFIDANGNFKETVGLQPGINNIEIASINRVQKETIKVVKVLAEF